MKFSHFNSVQSLAIVGATGLVGREFLSILSENGIRIPRVKLLASERSVGELIEFLDDDLVVEALTPESFEGIEVALFSLPIGATRKYVPLAVEAGTLVIDDSSTFRMEEDVPLVVPEINAAILRDFDGKIVATPNCSTTPVAMCLKPLSDTYGVKRVVISTYQSVSGAGARAYEELSRQTIALLNGAVEEGEVFAHRIAFNCLPQIGGALENGNCDEEEKVGRELRKILDLPDLRVSATTVRVPTFCGHGVSVNVELEQDFSNIDLVRELLDGFPGLKVLDEPKNQIYPTNVEAIGSDLTLVGRIRRDTSVDAGLNFWTITDNLRKGAALNSLQILDVVYNYRRMS